MPNHWLDKVIELINAPTSDLRKLAKIAGTDDLKNFYNGANFRDADLTDEDLIGLNLDAAILDDCQLTVDQRKKYLSESDKNSALIPIALKVQSVEDLVTDREWLEEIQFWLQTEKIRTEKVFGSDTESVLTIAIPQRSKKSFHRFVATNGLKKYGVIGLHESTFDLSGEVFRSAKLMHANLTGADLSHAKLMHANLTGADLSHANLTGADLTGAKLMHANLTGADLSHAKLMHADLTGADLSHANLTGVDITYTVLPHANLVRAGFTTLN